MDKRSASPSWRPPRGLPAKLAQSPRSPVTPRILWSHLRSGSARGEKTRWSRPEGGRLTFESRLGPPSHLFLPDIAHHRSLERAGLRSQFQSLRQGFLRNRLRNKKPSSRPPRTGTADRGTREGSVPTLAIVVETFSKLCIRPFGLTGALRSILAARRGVSCRNPPSIRARRRTPRRYAASRPFHPTDTPRNTEKPEERKTPEKVGVFWRVRRRSTRALGRGLL